MVETVIQQFVSDLYPVYISEIKNHLDLFLTYYLLFEQTMHSLCYYYLMIRCHDKALYIYLIYNLLIVKVVAF
jgi:hypothetical protein